MSFTARYEGMCGDCDQAIQRGQEVEYGADQELYHVRCPVPDPYCSVCGLYHRGEC